MADDPLLADFDADDVRAGLRLAFTVGLPVSGANQPTFFFAKTFTSTSSLDSEGVPFAANVQPTPTQPTSVKVPCSIEYHDGEGKLENFGVIVPSRVILTLIDEDYEKVKGFQFVVIKGNKFFYRRTEASPDLVTVGLWRVHCTAEDEG